MKTYRISWYALVEDGSVLEGRSLVTAENEKVAIQKLASQKSAEYRLSPRMIRIQSIYELPGFVS